MVGTAINIYASFENVSIGFLNKTHSIMAATAVVPVFPERKLGSGKVIITGKLFELDSGWRGGWGTIGVEKLD